MTDNRSEDLRTELARERNVLARERCDMAVRRTRLANRRTFLAWCRTALAFMTFGFLLEKVDTFVALQKAAAPARVVSDLAVLGKFAFVGGPVLVIFAAIRYYRLEKELGFDSGDLYVVPELILFGVIMVSAVIYLFIV
ncbi:YidH family protein [Pseudodesulfovibrio karagichevae]|uniref:YidH family protein n=1 Tax=Pseudodesulfovibrio karagichevae TaxID=3239305 RepID=A0ABV4K668_9BACT